MILKEHGMQSDSEVARALGLSEANVWHHILLEPGIYKPSTVVDYRSVAMNSDAMPEGGYRALDGGEWWLRDTPIEPSTK